MKYFFASRLLILTGLSGYFVEGDKNERNGAINIFDLASVADETSVGKDTLVRQISLTTINGTSVPKGSTCVLSSMLFSNAFEFEGIYVECECKPGYSGERIRCEEIDECITEFPCPLNETGGFCVDTDPDDDEFPFYKCGCKNGFETLAADEHGATVCGLPGDTLAPTFVPSRANTLMPSITGSPTPVPPIANCTACPEKSECALSTPGAPSAFDNGEGVFIVCLCKEGYTGDGWRCEDINECETEFPCPSNETGGFCVDTDPDDKEFPFYKCGCLEDYEAMDLDDHGATSCVYIGNETLTFNETLADNETSTSNDTSIIMKVPVVDEDRSDIVENCTSCPNDSICVLSSMNVSTAIAFEEIYVECECKPGYAGDGIRCEEIDECITEFPCPLNETGGFCVDTDPDDDEFPFYKCGCKNGFETLAADEHGATVCGLPGDTLAPTFMPSRANTLMPSITGSPTPVPPIANCTACPEKSECALSTPGAPSAFDNGEGVFIVCLCKEGYTGDGWRCKDINECETEFPCPSNETGGFCVDTDPDDEEFPFYKVETEFPCPSNETGGFCVDTDPDDEEFPFYKCGCLEGYAAVDVDEHGASSCEMATEAPSITPVPSTTSFPSGTNAPTLTGTPTLTGIPTLTGFPTLTSTPTGSPTATGIPTLTGTPTLSGSPSLSGSPTLTGKKKRRQ
eukprot:CAMPEP_0194161194 /NCGR_PEP_ID=MMETSP0152-20130528/78801_1 /TAXON_ID=1049557 /ORGANISM="Thalassiothrix antarctica, Strain L6-D1" /LENGTH=685 /DNA_ID=CAMNT_0038870951 /DNA_START=35 /DNA_END=2093 /DNA_ORIENTATION=+